MAASIRPIVYTEGLQPRAPGRAPAVYTAARPRPLGGGRLRGRLRDRPVLLGSNPYGTCHVDAQGTNPVDDTTRTAARIQAERAVKMATALKAAT
ncbi:hypothetical protein GCM10017744_089300 [Streptomyces antimycoticus]